MTFAGIQKLSLVDFDTEIACTLFTRGCDLNCPFCHNYELVINNTSLKDDISLEAALDYLKEKRKYLSAVVITGGEPTIHQDLKETIIKIKELGYKIKLDTNGFNPEVLIDLIKNNLINYVAVDIKNSKTEYAKTAGLSEVDFYKLDRTINYLINHEFPYEFRTTLIDEFHSDYSMEEIGKWLKGAHVLFLQHFQMSANVPNQSLHAVPTKKALGFRRILEKYIDKVELRGF